MNTHLKQLLEKFQQPHLLELIKKQLLDEREAIDAFSTLDSFYPISFNKKKEDTSTLTSFKNPIQSIKSNEFLVKSHLEKGSIASVILAGGDGSRLGFDMPKGCIPFCPKTKKSLFEIQIEKILESQKKTHTSSLLIILTSKNNHNSTVKFFKNNHFFGADERTIFFPLQPHFPFFTLQKKSFLKEPGLIATGPNGNGAIFKILKEFTLSFPNISTYQVINIDNPLASCMDVDLLQTHLSLENQITLRCIRLSNEHQKVGGLFNESNKTKIIDYTDQNEMEKPTFGSINIFAFSKEFIQKMTSTSILPIHWVLKEATKYDPTLKFYEKIPIFKGEIFITDAIEIADKITCIESNPTHYFAPVKSLEGEGSLKDAQEAYLKYKKI